MDSGVFGRWLDAYGRAWETEDPEAAADLFTEDATYYETPFDEPMRGRAEIHFSYEILTAEEGVAHWNASFVRLSTGTPVELDGVLLAQLDADGRCTEFREWWLIRE